MADQPVPISLSIPSSLLPLLSRAFLLSHPPSISNSSPFFFFLFLTMTRSRRAKQPPYTKKRRNERDKNATRVHLVTLPMSCLSCLLAGPHAIACDLPSFVAAR